MVGLGGTREEGVAEVGLVVEEEAIEEGLLGVVEREAGRLG